MSPIANRPRPRKKQSRGLLKEYFHGFIGSEAYIHANSEACKRDISMAKFITELILEHKTAQLRVASRNPLPLIDTKSRVN